MSDQDFSVRRYLDLLMLVGDVTFRDENHLPVGDSARMWAIEAAEQLRAMREHMTHYDRHLFACEQQRIRAELRRESTKETHV